MKEYLWQCYSISSRASIKNIWKDFFGLPPWISSPLRLIINPGIYPQNSLLRLCKEFYKNSYNGSFRNIFQNMFGTDFSRDLSSDFSMNTSNTFLYDSSISSPRNFSRDSFRNSYIYSCSKTTSLASRGLLQNEHS